jgi:MinD superfamily P-loop ATPase
MVAAAASGGRRLAVLSGKGGAGKTTVACGLARALHALGRVVTLVDADAEVPDAALVLVVEWRATTTVSLAVPAVDAARCDGCGACAAACHFNALAMAGRRPLVFPDLCHGCGACSLACRRGALGEGRHAIGSVRHGLTAWGALVEARTAVGAARASRVIAAALERAGPHGWQVVDGPPGTSCSAVAALAGASAALLVVEASPFGRHDAGLALELLRGRRVPVQAVLNRCQGDETERTRHWCAGLGLEVVAELPVDSDLDRAGAAGSDPWEHAPAFAAVCLALARRLSVDLPESIHAH